MKYSLKNKKKKGFTLIEMVAVVAIIGILAAILIPKVTGYMNEAKKTKVVDQARKVVQAVESAKMKGQTKGISGKLSDVKNIMVLDFLDYTTGGDDAAVGDLTADGEMLQNLKDDMTVAQCEHIASGKDFTLSDDKFSATR